VLCILTERGFAGYSENRMATMEITDTDFDEKVLKSTIPVLVDFWAPWCGPCRMAGPVLDELAEEYEGKVQIVKINIDNNQKSAGDYDVMSIPTTVLIKGGNEIGRQIGFGGKKVFEDLIKTGI
jgi:thioredoxin 1